MTSLWQRVSFVSISVAVVLACAAVPLADSEEKFVPGCTLPWATIVIVGLKKDWEAAGKDDRAKELGEREEELHKRIKDLVAEDKKLQRLFSRVGHAGLVQSRIGR